MVESFDSFVAQIAEVSIGPEGEPKVHKVWCAVDCGVAVNPDIIRAQMEGGIGYGLGHALFGEITLDEGRPVQANFHDYRSLRIHEMPEVEVTIIALHRETDRRRRARRAADRACGRQCARRARPWPRRGSCPMQRRYRLMSGHLILAAAAALAVCVTGSALTLGAERRGRLNPARCDLEAGIELHRPSPISATARSPSSTRCGKVLQHPRCMNCHPATERPRQGDLRELHEPLVVRGKDGHGAAGAALRDLPRQGELRSRRASPATSIGRWHRPPWPGRARSLGQICEQLKDQNRNGSRDLAALVKHVTTDSLVLWGWKPGKGREPAPGTPAEFGALMQAWADTGAACPAS